MAHSSGGPPLKPLHPNSSLSLAKLVQMERLSTEALLRSLEPGQRDCLKARPDGTLLDGHHRIHILRKRGVAVDTLPREIVVKRETLTMWTELHWINGPWPGKLALAARPRGGDWLPDEIASWRRQGIDGVVSLLTPEEEHDLDLLNERREARRHEMSFTRFPIPDRQVPASQSDTTEALEMLGAELSAGRNVVIHCRQGIGRTGLMAACLLVAAGNEPQTAIREISVARGVPIPETDEQRRWIAEYAVALSGAR